MYNFALAVLELSSNGPEARGSYSEDQKQNSGSSHKKYITQHVLTQSIPQ
jgi:hypothetical protein